jgi:RNA-binding protein
MELSGSQKRHLRSLGNRMPVVMSLGKAGLTEGVAGALKDLFARQELLKVRLPAGAPPDREALAGKLALAAGAVVAGSVGRTVLLYKPNETLPPEKRIDLPD